MVKKLLTEVTVSKTHLVCLMLNSGCFGLKDYKLYSVL